MMLCFSQHCQPRFVIALGKQRDHQAFPFLLTCRWKKCCTCSPYMWHLQSFTGRPQGDVVTSALSARRVNESNHPRRVNPLNGKRRCGEHFLGRCFLAAPSRETRTRRRTIRKRAEGDFLITVWREIGRGTYNSEL